MAEAVVEADLPRPSPKFYCHLCNTEVQTVNADFTCPICSGGFVEEILESNNENVSEDASLQDSVDNERREFAQQFMTLGRRNGGGNNIRSGHDSADGGDDESSGSDAPRRPRPYRRNVRVHNVGRLDNVLLEILQSLTAGNDDWGNTTFFMGNPGDYAWGREGIDAIVTQLLNQMDTTGPPPLSKEKIDQIPNVNITQEQVDVKLQCSVCWEDFILDESVRKLPCLHFYHENCIVPWLELHGTCPICRKSLSPDGQVAPDVANTLRNALMNAASEEDLGESSFLSSNSVNDSMSSNDTGNLQHQQENNASTSTSSQQQSTPVQSSQHHDDEDEIRPGRVFSHLLSRILGNSAGILSPQSPPQPQSFLLSFANDGFDNLRFTPTTSNQQQNNDGQQQQQSFRISNNTNSGDTTNIRDQEMQENRTTSTVTPSSSSPATTTNNTTSRNSRSNNDDEPFFIGFD